MKQKNKKRVGVLGLIAAMVFTSFPQFNMETHAAETRASSPSDTQFATAGQLRYFNTDNTDNQVKSAQLYFGNNDQRWWIVGSQSKNSLTLFAECCFPGYEYGEKFEAEAGDPVLTDYIYTDGSTPTEVADNHYGKSNVRAVLKELETTYFTENEQNLMLETEIYTKDEYNSNVYATQDKLYLAYGSEAVADIKYITGGRNSESRLNGGLRIELEYWDTISDHDFWLRTPSRYGDHRVLIGFPPRYGVYEESTFNIRGVRPLFELDLSSVLFGSVVSAVSSEGRVPTSSIFTLRCATDTLGTAETSYDGTKVNVSDVPKGTYLVVQDSAGAYAKAVSGTCSVTAGEMGRTSLRNCEVWLETTIDRVTYATMATDEPEKQEYSIEVTENTGLNLTSGNGTQVVREGETIEDITVEVEDGYYLPEGYIDSIQGLEESGLNVVLNETENGFTISGTPTEDVNITLPAAAVLPKADTPEVDVIKTTATSIEVNVTNHREEFGTIEYKWGDGNWEEDKKVASDLTPDTSYNLAVRFTGNGFYQMSEEAVLEIRTMQEGSVTVPTGLTVTYKEGLKLSDVDLSSTGWIWADGEVALSAGTENHLAYFDTSSLENTQDFSSVEGYDKDNHRVEREIPVIVEKGMSSVTITTETLDKSYDGNAVSAPEYTTSGSKGNKTITWQENKGTADAPVWENIDNAPTKVGNYRVIVALAEDSNYKSAETVLEFVIKKAIPIPDQVTGLVIVQGHPLSELELPEQFQWVDETQIADELGTHSFKAIYTPEDTVNYETVETEIDVKVVLEASIINHIPTISASDKTITVGEKFDPLKDVTAKDKEDGNLTSKIEVVKNTVDTEKAGIYEVIYQVTDSQDAFVTKTIKVTVKAKAVPTEPDKNKPDKNKPDKNKTENDKVGGSVETGDRANPLLWGVLLSGSSVILLYSLYRMKRKMNQ